MSPIDLEAAARLLVHQFILFGHIIAFTLALAEVLRADWRLLRSSRLDIEGLEQAARRLTWLLLLLWASGIPLVGFAVDWDFLRLAHAPKLASKSIVVTALTLNGILLHAVVFPMLRGRRGSARMGAVVSSILGAVSTVSWLYASFVGAARLIAPKMSLADFLDLYAAVLITAAAAALLVVAPRIEKMIRDRKRIVALERLSHPSNGEVLVLLRQLEDRILSRDGSPTFRTAHV